MTGDHLLKKNVQNYFFCSDFVKLKCESLREILIIYKAKFVDCLVLGPSQF